MQLKYSVQYAQLRKKDIRTALSLCAIFIQKATAHKSLRYSNNLHKIIFFYLITAHKVKLCVSKLLPIKDTSFTEH